MNKKITLTESMLRNIIRESVTQCLNEFNFFGRKQADQQQPPKKSPFADFDEAQRKYWEKERRNKIDQENNEWAEKQRGIARGEQGRPQEIQHTGNPTYRDPITDYMGTNPLNR